MTAQPVELVYIRTVPDYLKDVDEQQLFTDANTFIGAIFNMLDDDTREALEASDPHLWRVQSAANENPDRAVWHLGFVLALDALAKHPDVLQAAVGEFALRLRLCLPEPFRMLEEMDPAMKKETLELIGRLLGEE